MTNEPRIITGKVSEWIACLRELVPEYGDYVTFLVFTSSDKQIEEHAIRSIEVDAGESEVNLCAEPVDEEPLSLHAVLRRLDELTPDQRSYHLFSASPYKELPDGVEVRFDAPIVNIVADPAGKRLGFAGPGIEVDEPPSSASGTPE